MQNIENIQQYPRYNEAVEQAEQFGIGNLTEIFNAAEHKVELAKEANPLLLWFATEICTRILRLYPEDHEDFSELIKEGPLKRVDDIAMKAIQKHEGDVSQVHDICRLTIWFSNPYAIELMRGFYDEEHLEQMHDRTFVDKVHKMHKEMEDRGVSIIEVKDSFLKPRRHGYIALHSCFAICVKNGTAEGEFQYRFLPMKDVYDASRELYEEIRGKNNRIIAIEETEKKRLLTQDEREEKRRLETEIENSLEYNKQQYINARHKYGLDRYAEKETPILLETEDFSLVERRSQFLEFEYC